jgi:hypothetical protein
VSSHKNDHPATGPELAPKLELAAARGASFTRATKARTITSRVVLRDTLWQMSGHSAEIVSRVVHLNTDQAVKNLVAELRCARFHSP